MYSQDSGLERELEKKRDKKGQNIGRTYAPAS